MSRKRTTGLSLLTLILFSASLLGGCAKPAPQSTTAEPEHRAEPTPVLPPQKSDLVQALASPTPTPPKPAPLPPPTIAQIRNAVARVFAKTAAPDTSLPEAYVVGDFNGDGFEDLAVALKVSDGYLGEINDELANWILEDPRKLALNRTVSTTRPPPAKTVRAEKGDSLLAIIHGIGPQGWRAPEAKQTFLLKNGAGSNILALPADRVRNVPQKLPPLKGDVIKENIGSSSGFIFWTGAWYAWHSWSPG
jgi:hypothetical protein